MATCAGVQVSRNSQGVLDCAPFMENFPQHHWRASQEPQILLANLTVTTVPFIRYPEKVTVS